MDWGIGLDQEGLALLDLVWLGLAWLGLAKLDCIEEVSLIQRVLLVTCLGHVR